MSLLVGIYEIWTQSSRLKGREGLWGGHTYLLTVSVLILLRASLSQGTALPWLEENKYAAKGSSDDQEPVFLNLLLLSSGLTVYCRHAL